MQRTALVRGIRSAGWKVFGRTPPTSRCCMFSMALTQSAYIQPRTYHAPALYSTVSAEREPAVAKTGADACPAAVDPSKLDIRVGRILECTVHPDADSLYVESIDVGDAEGPRTIISGLLKYCPREALQGRRVVVLTNLPPRTMRGIRSSGMLLCASNTDHSVVEPLEPPEGTPIGERVWFGEERCQGEPARPNQVQKKKLWEAVQPLLHTEDGRMATFRGQPMQTSGGPVMAPTLPGASIS